MDVPRDVYPPSEDTELLLEALARLAPSQTESEAQSPRSPRAGDERPGAVRTKAAPESEPAHWSRALDVGTGSGALAFALAERAERVVATDVNPAALAYAAQAARERRLANVAFVRADLVGPLRGAFDCVTFNAPYLPSTDEERVAGPLDAAFHGGEGGVEVARRFVRELPRVLAPRGFALLVLSDRGDVASVEAEAKRAGLAFEEVARAAFFFERILVFRITRMT
ncbi:MAG: HemK2/MTQ2 family protein methyltransferase [Thermoplasmatota archaeon]